jgi:hypothetical protein
MWEHCDAAHDRLDRIRIDDPVLYAGNEECRLAAFEVVVEVDEEGEQGGLASIGR